jgi:hypothetical protein
MGFRKVVRDIKTPPDFDPTIFDKQELEKESDTIFCTFLSLRKFRSQISVLFSIRLVDYITFFFTL